MVSVSAISGLTNSLQPAAGRPVSTSAFATQIAQLQTGASQGKKHLDGLVTIGVSEGTKLRPAQQTLKAADVEPGLVRKILESLDYDLKKYPELPEQLSWVMTYDEYDYDNTIFEGKGIAGNVFAAFKPGSQEGAQWFAGVDPNQIDTLHKLYGFTGSNARDDLYKEVVTNEVSAKLLVSQFPSIDRQEAELLSEKVSLDVTENGWFGTLNAAFSRDPEDHKRYKLIGRAAAAALAKTMEQYGVKTRSEQDKLALQLINSLSAKSDVL